MKLELDVPPAVLYQLADIALHLATQADKTVELVEVAGIDEAARWNAKRDGWRAVYRAISEAGPRGPMFRS